MLVPAQLVLIAYSVVTITIFAITNSLYPFACL